MPRSAEISVAIGQTWHPGAQAAFGENAQQILSILGRPSDDHDGQDGEARESTGRRARSTYDVSSNDKHEYERKVDDEEGRMAIGGKIISSVSKIEIDLGTFICQLKPL